MTTFNFLLLVSNVVMIVAVFLGPIAAVRITRRQDKEKEQRNRQLDTYRTLMATRADGLSERHVEALNSIDLNFAGRRKAERDVREAWGIYLNWLGTKNVQPDQWNIRRAELQVDLLQKMGRCLNYDFDKDHIERSIYFPTAHGQIGMDQAAIRQGVLEVLDGKRPLPLYVVNLPLVQSDDEHRNPPGSTSGLVP